MIDLKLASGGVDRLTALLMLLLFTACHHEQQLPIDDVATKETINLYNNLKKIPQHGFMVGHQDDLAYGVEWKYEEGRSDVKEVAGDYPAVYGYDLGHLEIGAKANLDSVPFHKMKDFIRQGYSRGGVITLSWHGNNPMTGGSSWDPAPGSVAAILPGGEKHDVFRAQLDRVAEFILDLKGENGEYIPVLFRPFHEHTGGWFWWGNKSSTAEEYKKLFRFTVSYLKDEKQVHNLLYVYNTGSEFSTADEYLERYPGDDVVDLLTFDTYQSGDPSVDNSFEQSIVSHLSIIDSLAKVKNKISAFGETGFVQIPYDEWWTETLLDAMLQTDAIYVLMWRNAGYKPVEDHVEYYMPYPGHPSVDDFVDFYNHPKTLFENEVEAMNLYE